MLVVCYFLLSQERIVLRNLALPPNSFVKDLFKNQSHQNRTDRRQSSVDAANMFTNMINEYNHFIILDLKITHTGEEDAILTPEIIEIGCVVVDCCTLEIIDSFSKLIEPTLNHNPYKRIYFADKFLVVADEFKEWLSGFRNAPIFTLCKKDCKQINIDSNRNGICSPIINETIFDLKTLTIELGFTKKNFHFKTQIPEITSEQRSEVSAIKNAVNAARLLPFMRKTAITIANNLLTLDEIRRYSKLLTLILRHFPSKANVTLNSQGWCDIVLLIDGIHNYNGYNLSPELIIEIVSRASDKRFQLSQDLSQMRCVRDHSIPHIAAN